jgi:hypothetical protein
MPRELQYKPEIAEELCDWLANGGSLRAWCAQEGKPTFSTIYKWLEREEAFADAYARARERQAHNDGDRMNEIASKLEAGEIAPDVARVMADILKWTAGKRAAKFYGDKVALSNDDGAPLIVTWSNGSKV